MTGTRSKLPSFLSPNLAQFPNAPDVSVNSLRNNILPPNAVTQINGRVASSMLYNPAQNTFTNNIYETPRQTDITNRGELLLRDSLSGARNVVNTAGNDRESFFNDLFNPAKRKLDDAYNDSLNNSIGNFNSSGSLGTLGFQRYRANKLDRNYQEGISDLASQSRVNAEQLPNIRIAPFLNAIGTATGSLDAGLGRNMSLLNPSFQGGQVGNSILNNNLNTSANLALQDFTNRAKISQLQNDLNLNAANLQNQFNLQNYQLSKLQRNKLFGIF